MLGKKMFFIPAFAALFACAEPKYIIAQETKRENAFQSQKATECELRFRNSGYCLLWQWEKMPTSTEPGSLTFKIVRANALDDSPVPVNLDLAPALVLWMPSMGHGSIPTIVEQIDTGTYRAKNVFFIMPGDWELRFQIKDGSTIHDEAVVSLII